MTVSFIFFALSSPQDQLQQGKEYRFGMFEDFPCRYFTFRVMEDISLEVGIIRNQILICYFDIVVDAGFPLHRPLCLTFITRLDFHFLAY